MFERDSVDMCLGKFPFMLMGGRAESLACADPGVRTPIGVSGTFHVPTVTVSTLHNHISRMRVQL